MSDALLTLTPRELGLMAPEFARLREIDAERAEIGDRIGRFVKMRTGRDDAMTLNPETGEVRLAEASAPESGRPFEEPAPAEPQSVALPTSADT